MVTQGCKFVGKVRSGQIMFQRQPFADNVIVMPAPPIPTFVPDKWLYLYTMYKCLLGNAC